MALTLNGTTGIAGIAGSAGTPALQGNNDANTGYFFATDTLGLSTAGTERLKVTSAGLISIGDNSNLDSQLTITQSVGDCIRLRTSASNNTYKYGIIKLEPYNNNALGVQIVGAKSDSGYTEVDLGGGIDGGYAATQLDFWTAANTTTATGSRRMRIASDGKVGIGTTSPSFKLQIQGTDNAGSGLYLYNGTGGEGIKIVPESNGNCRIYSSTADALALGTNSTDRITMAADGSNIIFSGADFGFGTTPGGTPAGKNVFIAIGDSDTGIVQDGDGQLELWANATEVANINAIDGYTSTKPITTTGAVQTGDLTVLNATPDLKLKDSNHTGNSTEHTIYFKDSTGANQMNIGSPTGEQHLRIKHDTTNLIKIQTDGKVGINETSPVNLLTISNASQQTDSVGNLQIRYTGSDGAYNSGLTVKNYKGTSQFMQWADGGVRIGSRILTNSGAGNIYFTTGSDSVKATLLASNGNLELGGGGNLKVNNGAGIDFSDTAGSGNSELLSDYEHGNWVPTSAQGGWTVSNTYSKYVKIGNLVHLQMYISLSGTGNSNNLQIGGMPFAAGANGYAVGTVDFGEGGIKGNYMRTMSSASTLSFLYPSENPSNGRLNLAANQVGDSYVIATISYVIDGT
tara:strand:+ start:501 stop:2387 length:1887 start_codon:yes stop_codon:yes gene_type:complete